MDQSSLTVPSSRVTGVRRGVVRGQDPGLPLQVAALHREAQGERFDLDAGLGQLGDVLDRQVAHPEAALRRGDQQPLLGQAGERLPDDGLAHPEPFGESGHLQLLAGMQASVEQLTRRISYTCSVRVAGVSSRPQHSLLSLNNGF